MKFFTYIFASLVIASFSFFLGLNWQKLTSHNFQESNSFKTEKPLENYTFENLSKAQFKPGEITLGKVVKDEDNFTSQVFYFYVDPQTNSGQTKKVSGVINIPKKSGNLPVIVMFRGYVDREKYSSGVGTQRAGEYFAKNGFITLAPDFLGYGESDNPSENPIEERFQTYTTALTLLESIQNLNKTLISNNLDVNANTTKVSIWGHSNGGQIAISILEITDRSYPIVLWAPVTKPFPYAILYYTDEFSDRGKLLRRVLADFEKDYDVELYNPANFFEKINAPMSLHQGLNDESVPAKWSDEFYDKLKDLDKDIVYFKYPNADHNLSPSGWSQAASRSLEFYKDNSDKVI